MSEELWKKIEVILNHTAREVLKIRPLKMHVKDLYRVLDWLPASACRDYHDLSLFWSMKHFQTPRNMSLMFASHSDTIGDENQRRVTRSVTQNSINRTQDNDSRLSLRASSFVPRMVRTFNGLDQDYKRLPDLRDRRGNPRSAAEKFVALKVSLRYKCQTDHLGPEADWPACKADAMLDRSYELAGLGIESDTSEEGPEDEAAGPDPGAADAADGGTIP